MTRLTTLHTLAATLVLAGGLYGALAPATGAALANGPAPHGSSVPTRAAARLHTAQVGPHPRLIIRATLRPLLIMYHGSVYPRLLLSAVHGSVYPRPLLAQQRGSTHPRPLLIMVNRGMHLRADGLIQVLQ